MAIDMDMDMDMDTEVPESIHTKRPLDGHCILLMMTSSKQRTFSDYPSVAQCMDTVSHLYEEHFSLKKSSYVFQDVCDWIDGFELFELFTYDATIMRYKRNDCTRVKKLFKDVLEAMS